MAYTLCVHMLCYRCIWATHYVYMWCVIGVDELHTMCTCAMLYGMGHIKVPVFCKLKNAILPRNASYKKRHGAFKR